MKKSLYCVLVLLMGAALVGCGKKADQPAHAHDATGQEPCCPAHEMSAPAPAAEEASPAAKAEAELVAIPLTLPLPMFIGTPENIAGVQNLERPLGHPRPPFLAPEGVANVALDKPVTSSETFPIMGELDMIVDGDKEAAESSVVELGPFAQWVVIDLEQQHDIYAIVVWHYHQTSRVYLNVVVEVSNDAEFIDSTVVFNNDNKNALGLGVGTDMNYVETSEGKLIDCKGIRGRYVRLWSQGNNQNDYNHYVEVEVYGK